MYSNNFAFIYRKKYLFYVFWQAEVTFCQIIFSVTDIIHLFAHQIPYLFGMLKVLRKFSNNTKLPIRFSVVHFFIFKVWTIQNVIYKEASEILCYFHVLIAQVGLLIEITR